jgi:hypothetical protein
MSSDNKALFEKLIPKRKQIVVDLDRILTDAGQEALRSAHETGDLEKLSKGADAVRALAEAREVNPSDGSPGGLSCLPPGQRL